MDGQKAKEPLPYRKESKGAVAVKDGGMEGQEGWMEVKKKGKE